ncbi:PadR family transcriptional regulator [Saccharibacillus sp. CPCC 101409]|uniref:PadR family transcriptional regulator n=1 Tax=Saccharibacillus sp. CPCC 101409 TaxID=3058041 RepID=UPI002673C320|nr:PadR family transcriptional regulator [Saccharibacillus sp. CPCC 101409]MDO3411849.1 PadR family transcriptional regulator [Saccharibacillus sp. CPCC 101409]
MNTLSYGLLALVSRKEASGYDLMLKIQPFWQAKHSQIYPLLGGMEEKGLLSAKWVQQTDKPDKKLYSITPEGTKMLHEWLSEPTSAPVMRDEFNLKCFCIHMADPAEVHRLFVERRKYHIDRMKYYKDIQESIPPEHRNPGHIAFEDYILLQKAYMRTKASVDWIDWVEELVGQWQPQA